MPPAKLLAHCVLLVCAGSTASPAHQPSAENCFIGSASMREDRSVFLMLRAEGPNGVIGDSAFEYAPGHPEYDEIVRHVGPIEPGQDKAVPCWPEKADDGYPAAAEAPTAPSSRFARSAPLQSSGVSAPAIPAGELTRSLGLLEELARRGGIRVFAIPVAVGECWGSLASCPDVELVLSHTSGDLYEPPTAYALPMAKSWTFVGWVDEDTLVLRTTLPDAHIADEERAAWKAVEYTVTVSQDGARYESKTLD